MQNYIIRYVEDLKAHIEPTGCSINQALGVILPTYEEARIQKLRAAVADLERILVLELLRRDALKTAFLREGYKRTSDCGGISWRVYPAGVSDAAIRSQLSEPDGYYQGPGLSFSRGICIRRTSTRVLVTQFTGLDV